LASIVVSRLFGNDQSSIRSDDRLALNIRRRQIGMVFRAAAISRTLISKLRFSQLNIYTDRL
jgi:hypothetical protein